MKCSEVEGTIIRLACGLLTEASDRERALDHLDECDACRARMSVQRSIEQALDGLRVQDRACEAPDRVRLTLLESFEAGIGKEAGLRGVSQAEKGIGYSMRWMAGVAAAMLVCSLVAIGIWRANEPVSAPPEAVRLVEKSLPAVMPSPAISAPVAKTLINRRQKAIAVARESDAPDTPDALDNAELISLRPGSDTEPSEFERVVYMRISRSTLALWGVTVTGEGAGEQIDAKVFFGEDGVPRAIRILSN